jgi:hypothetical protein
MLHGHWWVSIKKDNQCAPCVWYGIFKVVYIEKFGWMNNVTCGTISTLNLNM